MPRKNEQEKKTNGKQGEPSELTLEDKNGSYLLGSSDDVFLEGDLSETDGSTTDPLEDNDDILYIEEGCEETLLAPHEIKKHEIKKEDEDTDFFSEDASETLTEEMEFKEEIVEKPNLFKKAINFSKKVTGFFKKN